MYSLDSTAKWSTACSGRMGLLFVVYSKTWFVNAKCGTVLFRICQRREKYCFKIESIIL